MRVLVRNSFMLAGAPDVGNSSAGYISTVFALSVCFNIALSNYREEEIIMPDEHSGVVKENYQWKV